MAGWRAGPPGLIVEVSGRDDTDQAKGNYMICFRCASPNPDVARFCHRCGAILIPDANRNDYYAAQPAESVRALAVVSTLMPHVTQHRSHLYRLGLGIALVAALIAAGFGILPVALVCAGIALPGMLLLYFYDHEVWVDEPGKVIAVCVVLAAAIGVGIGFLDLAFTPLRLGLGFTTLNGAQNNLPSTGTLLAQCILLPAAATIALLIAPLIITARPKFGHALDALTLSALAGVAFALAESIVIQHGAFSHLTARSTNAASDAFIALTLGFAKPVIYAAATALAVMRLRRKSGNFPLGLLEAFLLIAVYDTSVATLTTFGQRGLVFIFLIAIVVACIGLLLVRDEAHQALLMEAEEAAKVEHDVGGYGGLCANCQMPLLEGSAFCLACGTAVKAMPKQHQRAIAAEGGAQPDHSDGVSSGSGISA